MGKAGPAFRYVNILTSSLIPLLIDTYLCINICIYYIYDTNNDRFVSSLLLLIGITVLTLSLDRSSTLGIIISYHIISYLVYAVTFISCINVGLTT